MTRGSEKRSTKKDQARVDRKRRRSVTDSPTAAKNEAVRRVLLGAVRVIQTRGWCQRQSEDALGRVCILQAVWAKNSGALYRVARRRLDRMLGDAIDWNDAEGRTQAEVVAKLREAASHV